MPVFGRFGAREAGPAGCRRSVGSFATNGSLGNGHGALRILPRALRMQSAFIAPATALAVGPFREQGCERSELPCLARGGKKLGRRSWSFLRLWCLLSGIMGEPSALPMDFEACGGMSCKGDRMAMVAADCPLMAGGQARISAPEAFLRVLKPAASPLRTPRSCLRMTGGGAPTIHPSTLEGSPTIITAVFGRPFQGRFPLGLLSPGHSASQR